MRVHGDSDENSTTAVATGTLLPEICLQLRDGLVGLRGAVVVAGVCTARRSGGVRRLRAGLPLRRRRRQGALLQIRVLLSV